MRQNVGNVLASVKPSSVELTSVTVAVGQLVLATVGPDVSSVSALKIGYENALYKFTFDV